MKKSKSNNVHISVVIPAFNEEKRLPKCLLSLKKQTYKNYEIIVVDNNSQDKTAAIARRFGANVFKEKIQGMIPARNRGYDSAKGEIIARTDADTILPVNWLEKINNLFEKHPRAVAVTGSVVFPGAIKGTHWLINLFTKFANIYLSNLLMGHFWIIGPNHAIRKSAWQKIRKKVNLNDKKVHEDMDLSCCLYPYGKLIYSPDLKIQISLRRWKINFWYTLVDYTFRYFRTIFIHHPFLRRHRKYYL